MSHSMNIIKQERIYNNEKEKKLINQYLKYENMLKRDVLYTRERGARSASRIQNNKVLSELLGYKSHNGGRININFENLDRNKTSSHEIIEINATDKCMICGEPLHRNYPYHRVDNCKKCNLFSCQGFNKHPWSFYEKGKVLEQKSDIHETTFEDDNLKLTAKVEIVESILQNCCCKWKEFRKKNDFVVDAYIEIPIYKPIIYIQDCSSYNLGTVEFAHDINTAHAAVLGWRVISLKFGLNGKPPLKDSNT